ncbi:unnamed protein product [Thelazia callipaeda]|uniref:Ribosomal_L7Ae domain-containing protein n=1 Tax=Thelazia callipaeda TaxID=103827 RepID=A0A0N5DC89_THECL|nr:unnamed protein product [Thelazia callipaeda]
MRRGQVSRPYLKCKLKFNWHTERQMSAEFLVSLANFLIEHGFKRRTKLRRKNQLNGKNHEPKKHGEICDVNEGNLKNNSGIIRKSSIAVVGMRSVLRNMQQNRLSAVFFDSDIIKPSSVATTLGLLCLNLGKQNVYGIRNLSSTLSEALNMPRVGAVGFMSGQAEELCQAAFSSLTGVTSSHNVRFLLS